MNIERRQKKWTEGKLYHKQSQAEKMQMKTIKMHKQRNTKQKNNEKTPQGAVPACLLDRKGQSPAKVVSNAIKLKGKEKAGKMGSSSAQSSCPRRNVSIKSYSKLEREKRRHGRGWLCWRWLYKKTT